MPTTGEQSGRLPGRSEGAARSACPVWLFAADLATIGFLCAAVWVLASGGLRTSIVGTTVSVTSPGRLVLLAVAITFVRHVVRRRPSLLDSVRAARPRPWSSAWSETLALWSISRVSVILVGYVAVLTFGFAEPPPFRFFENAFANLPARWDTGWYVDIALNGYRWRDDSDRQQNVAFFPAFPLVMGAGGALLGAYAPGTDPPIAQQRLVTAGWIVGLAAFWFALVYVYRWSETRAGPTAAKATVTLLAAYPFAVFFSAPYTEPLYLLGAAAAFVHFERAEWFRSAGWGLLVGLVRPNGVLLTIPLALIAAQGRRHDARLGTGVGLWIALAAPAVAFLLHSIYLQQLTGRAFVWAEAQAAWGRTYEVTSWAGAAFGEVAEKGAVRYLETAPITVLNGLTVALAALLLWPVTKAAGLPYSVFVLVNLLPALASGGLMSVGRFTSALFPLFFALATSIREQQLPGWVVGFSVLQGLLAVLFFTWRPLF